MVVAVVAGAGVDCKPCAGRFAQLDSSISTTTGTAHKAGTASWRALHARPPHSPPLSTRRLLLTPWPR